MENKDVFGTYPKNKTHKLRSSEGILLASRDIITTAAAVYNSFSPFSYDFSRSNLKIILFSTYDNDEQNDVKFIHCHMRSNFYSVRTPRSIYNEDTPIISIHCENCDVTLLWIVCLI